MIPRYLDVQQVAEVFSFKSTATVWRKVKTEPGFPTPVKIGPNSTRWVESEVADFITKQVRAARGDAAESPAAA